MRSENRGKSETQEVTETFSLSFYVKKMGISELNLSYAVDDFYEYINLLNIRGMQSRKGQFFSLLS